ncbi:DgyrCDS1162 [Dimorphilus gyrociliatus]|uniref:Tyrosine-protein kinase n=1 Tax=Dimorphilus gyrociliatus TaxID=2664684 RepID=A0A7I8VBJ5_9ANNE|nr:DgyrCDS1162 [Dimorphilus gyrociliatus]
MLDGFRKFLIEKLKIESTYATTMDSLILSTSKTLNACKTDTKIFQVLSQILEANRNLICILKERCEKLSTETLKKIVQISNDKKALRKNFQEEKNRLDSLEKTAQNELNLSRQAYKQSMKAYLNEKCKFERECATSKDYSNSKENKIKTLYDKYYSSAGKLHNSHNNYVLSLSQLQEKQKLVHEVCYPALLDCQQSQMEIAVHQWSDILTEYVETSNMTDRNCQKLYSNLTSSFFDIRPKSEYENFINQNKSNPESIKSILFDESILQDYQGDLQMEQLRVDVATIDDLKSRLVGFEDEKASHEQRRKVYDTEISDLRDRKYRRTLQRRDEEENGEAYEIDRKIKILDKQVKEEGGLIDMNYILYQKINKSIRSCTQHWPHTIKELQDVLPKSIEISNSTQQEGAVPNTPSNSKMGLLQRLENILRKPKSVQKESADIEESEDESYAPQDDVEHLSYYHGLLPRAQAQEYLENDGDYLLRFKADDNHPTQYVLSAKHRDRHKHFVIQVSKNRNYKLDGPEFSTIHQLVKHYEKNKIPATEKSGVILRRAVDKPQWSINNDDIERGDKIGSGNFGDVYIGKYKKTNQEVAIKTCRFDVPAEERARFLKEGLILSNYEHPKIVKFIGIAATRTPMMIVMEYVPNGALRDYLMKHYDLKIKRLVRMCCDAAEGMNFLSRKGIIHRDLAARNCLVDIDETVKISDFGLSRKGDDEGTYQIIENRKRSLPLKWTAPEGLEKGSFTTKSDVWSFGVLMWEIFSFGEMPYPKLDSNNRPIKNLHLSGQETKDFVFQKKTMQPPPNMSQEMNKLMQNCWQYEPEDRPEFERISLALHVIYKES